MMASLNPRTLHLPIDDEVEYIIIDHYGDLLLTLHDPYTVNSPKYPCTFLFQVSSKVLCLTSHYFHQAFQHKWLETTLQADEKYHFSCTGFDAEAMYVLLLTLHKEALYRSDYDYRVTQSLPSEVPLDTLMGMVEIMDYWQTLPASQILQHTSERWFEQFQFKSSRVWNDWDLPDEYGSEIMMWWCLAENFDPVSKNGMSLRDAVERVIFKNAKGPIEGFGWPIRKQQLEELEYWRDWNASYAWELEN